jgi:hypothetical protein
MTQINFGDNQFEVDAEAEWKAFEQLEPAEQAAEAARGFFWLVHLPTFDQPEEIRQAFWKSFSSTERERTRIAAVHGLAYANKGDLLALLNRAIKLDRDQQAQERTGEDLIHSAAGLGFEFASLAAKKDHKPFQALAGIIKEGGIPSGAESGRSGPFSEQGIVFAAFSKLVATHRRLPTKKELRSEAGLDPDEDNLRKSLKPLGLSGLPDAKTKF